jgi:hypothetical protein
MGEKSDSRMKKKKSLVNNARTKPAPNLIQFVSVSIKL